jgi:ferritin-like protein
LIRGLSVTAAGAGSGAAWGVLFEPAAARAAATPAAQPETAAQRLVRLLGVELLLLYAYEHVLGSSFLDSKAKQVLGLLRAQEEAHVHALQTRLTALGGAPPPRPTSVPAANRDLAHRRVSQRLGQLRGARDALRLLAAVERVTVGAYFVALIKLEDPALIRLAAEIMANEAQHEAMLGELLHPRDVQQAVPYGLIQGVQ